MATFIGGDTKSAVASSSGGGAARAAVRIVCGCRRAPERAPRDQLKAFWMPADTRLENIMGA